MSDKEQQAKASSSADTMQTCENPTVTSQPIDEVLALIVSVNDTTQWLLIAHKLNKLSEAQLRSYTSDNLDPLTILDPAVHSLGYLYFITARCLIADADNAGQLLQMLCHFIDVVDIQQLRLAPARVAMVATALEHLATSLEKPMVPVLPLMTAIEKMASSPHVLTSLHAPLAKCCLLAKAYKYPLRILDQDIETVDPVTYATSIVSFLEYHYYGAMIYIGNKNFDRALDFLILVISAPTQNAVSAIQLEAFKKYSLVSLIHDGQWRTLPKYTSVMVTKSAKIRCLPYYEISKAFDNTDIRQFETLFDKHRAVFESDNHIGLMKQCHEALYRKRIKELTNVYMTVGIPDIAKKLDTMEPVSDEKVERILVDMITKDQLSASIAYSSYPDGSSIKMVSFHDSDKVAAPLLARQLEQRISNAAKVGDRVSKMDMAEGLEKEFQAKYMVLSSNSGQLASMPYDEDIDLPLDEDGKNMA